MKFRKGDKVRVLTEEEIIEKFGRVDRLGEHYLWSYARKYLGGVYTIRTAMRKSCRMEEITEYKTISFPYEIIEHTKDYRWECYLCGHGTNDLYELPQANIPVCKKCANDIAKQLIDNLLS